MRYMLCAAGGELTEKTDTGGDTHTIINREVGEPGFAVALHGDGIAVFVNDAGHVIGLPRNTVGTCLAATVARRAITPLAGPLVFTGWEDTHGMVPEIRSLSDTTAAGLRMVHRDLLIVLGHAEGAISGPQSWQRAMRELAAHVETAPTPTIEILSGEDALRYLLGGAS